MLKFTGRDGNVLKMDLLKWYEREQTYTIDNCLAYEISLGIESSFWKNNVSCKEANFYANFLCTTFVCKNEIEI